MRRALLLALIALHLFALAAPLLAIGRFAPPRPIEVCGEVVASRDYVLELRPRPLFTICEQEYLLHEVSPTLSIDTERDLMPGECAPVITLDLRGDPLGYDWFHRLVRAVARMLHI